MHRDSVFREMALAVLSSADSPLVVVGTDTDIGKTWVTSRLRYAVSQLGVPVITQKWVQTGPSPTDIDAHDAYVAVRNGDLAEVAGLRSLRLPYHFSMPASPHLAASHAGSEVDVVACIAATTQLRQDYWVLIEGAGGVMVPFTPTQLLVEIVALCGFPVLLVSENRIGAIHQVLSAVTVLQHYDVQTVGIVLSQKDPGLDSDVAADNLSVIRRYVDAAVWGVR